MWTDTHCHLDYRVVAEGVENEGAVGGSSESDSNHIAQSSSDRRLRTEPRVRDLDMGAVDEVLDSAHAAGVSAFLTVGCDRGSSQRAIDVAAAHDDVWASVGLHPHEARHGVDSIRDLLNAPRVIAVGEAGLDYYYDHSPRDQQRLAFAEQIAIAHELDLPLIIHTRDAWDDTFDILEAETVPTRTIFHCFTGGPDEARRCLDLGAYLSFSGIVTFKSATDVADAAVMCPQDRLLVETDSPYLAPVPRRGQANRPENVALVGAHIAHLRNMQAADVAHLTSHNARIAFPGLGS
ncbi:MAG: TatD family hydrolase [Actinomycetota bacterium]